MRTIALCKWPLNWGDRVHPVERALDSQLARSSRVFVGFSGGLDSTALMLAAIQVFGAKAVTALHVNHQLQPDADAFAAHCVAVCSDLEVELRQGCVVVAAGNTEAQARIARYEYYSRQVEQGSVLLLGHHAQDDAETLLMRMLQGRGLLTIPYGGAVGVGRFLRPLLQFTKDELREYVVARDVVWIEDLSNLDPAYDRNYLRQEVVPRIAARWPKFESGIARIGQHVGSLDAVLRREMAQKPNAVSLDSLPSERKMQVVWLRSFLQSRGHFLASDRALNEFCQQIKVTEAAQRRGAAWRSPTMQADGALLGVYDGWLIYEPTTPLRISLDSENASTVEVGQSRDLGWASLTLEPADESDASAFFATGVLSVRYRSGGEGIRLEHRGVTKTLKNLLAEHRIPPWRRDAYPLLFDDERLVSVPGVAVADSKDQLLNSGDGARWYKACLDGKSR